MKDDQDPAEILKNLISDMKEGYREASEQVGHAAADEDVIRQRMDEAREQGERRRSEAQLAAARGDVEEARNAERSANELADVHAQYLVELKRQMAAVVQLRAALAAMAQRIESAERQAEHLLQRRAKKPPAAPDGP